MPDKYQPKDQKKSSKMEFQMKVVLEIKMFTTQ